MTPAEIKAFFPAWLPPFFYDDSYAVPTADWLLNGFFPAWRTERTAKGLWQYTRENDCDNYARAFCVGAQDAWAQSHSDDDEAVAVGEFCYVRADGAGSHCIVAAFCETGLIFIEPQTGQRLALTPTEISTCFRCAF